MKKHSILLVDDEGSVRMTVARDLRSAGYEVTVAASGEEAIGLLRKGSQYDLVVTDLRMNDVDGIDVLREARELCPDVPVILLTGYGSLDSAVEALRLGAFDYILKPCQKDELLGRTANAIEKRELKIELARKNADFIANFEKLTREIAERKAAEESLEKSNAELEKTLADLKNAQALLIRNEKLSAIGLLSSGVAHEILNPLNIISIAVQMELKKELPDSTLERLRKIHEQVGRAVKIANNLRKFAHRKSEEISLVDVPKIFDKTASLVEHDLRMNNIRIERFCDEDLPPIHWEEDKLEQVFLNLLSNARDAMAGQRGGVIAFRAGVLDDKMIIRISDTGTGIPAEIIDKIFDPFFTTKDPGKGTGLGLFIVHSLIEKAGGGIRVESEVGKGSSFIIEFPITRQTV